MPQRPGHMGTWLWSSKLRNGGMRDAGGGESTRKIKHGSLMRCGVLDKSETDCWGGKTNFVLHH